MITEDQLSINSTESKLLYDIRSEMQKTNELLSQQLKALCAIAKHTEPKEEVKPVKPKMDKPKRGKNDAKNK